MLVFDEPPLKHGRRRRRALVSYVSNTTADVIYDGDAEAPTVSTPLPAPASVPMPVPEADGEEEEFKFGEGELVTKPVAPKADDEEDDVALVRLSLIPLIAASDVQPASIPRSKRTDMALAWKERGNALFKQQRYEEAQWLFVKAVHCITYDHELLHRTKAAQWTYLGRAYSGFLRSFDRNTPHIPAGSAECDQEDSSAWKPATGASVLAAKPGDLSGRLHAATICIDNGDGTYDIFFDDGGEELEGVPGSSLVRGRTEMEEAADRLRSDCLNNLARCQIKENLREALRTLTLACALSPDNFTSRLLRGQLLLKWGRLDDAKPHLHRALALQPDSKAAVEALGKLKRMVKEQAHKDRALYREFFKFIDASGVEI